MTHPWPQPDWTDEFIPDDEMTYDLQLLPGQQQVPFDVAVSTYGTNPYWPLPPSQPDPNPMPGPLYASAYADLPAGPNHESPARDAQSTAEALFAEFTKARRENRITFDKSKNRVGYAGDATSEWRKRLSSWRKLGVPEYVTRNCPDFLTALDELEPGRYKPSAERSDRKNTGNEYKGLLAEFNKALSDGKLKIDKRGRLKYADSATHDRWASRLSNWRTNGPPPIAVKECPAFVEELQRLFPGKYLPRTENPTRKHSRHPGQQNPGQATAWTGGDLDPAVTAQVAAFQGPWAPAAFPVNPTNPSGSPFPAAGHPAYPQQPQGHRP
ncbi:hypothetical protein ABT336_20615 [Micromonospora sp. NPDC000207]|uniref:hypothetical protein n=1 Tax=Micromonospora sp. NPDC000207 TaxID=3154246 RepID=UPI00332B68EA